MYAGAFQDGMIVLREGFGLGSIGIKGLEIALLCGYQQLGNHVPVDAAQSFVGIEGTTATGKCLVVECLFKQLKQRFLLCLGNADSLHGSRQVASIAECSVEVETSTHILAHQTLVTVRHHSLQQRRAVESFCRQAVLL